LKYLLGLLVLLNISDGVLTHFLVKFGLATEGNSFLLPVVGEPGFMIIKVLGAIICCFILWDIYRRRPRLAFMSASFFVACYGVIVLWNVGLFLA
jgi:hypothetical protein